MCPEHDDAANRLAVTEAWKELIRRTIAGQLAVARHKASPILQTACVRFTAGGMLSFLCTACAPTAQGTLRIDLPDGERAFIPMQHVREYSLRPYVPEESATEKASPAATPEPAASAPCAPEQPSSAGKTEKQAKVSPPASFVKVSAPKNAGKKAAPPPSEAITMPRDKK